ncbi:hypothetical protein N7450_011583 [Penicillium hetheringtonii]|uniref:Uncharacterized protein n=1 Tax=Penicillium hetheringtonii TaxID=911720 RepID=A0AAD6DA81_9EURO|nr:hypothetical protein N7450_011583 [Penicillium hetheringtonii]
MTPNEYRSIQQEEGKSRINDHHENHSFFRNCLRSRHKANVIRQYLCPSQITSPAPVPFDLVQLHVRRPLAVSVPTAKAYHCALENVRPLPQSLSIITHGRCKNTAMTFLTSNRDISWPLLRIPTGREYTEQYELSWTLMIDRGNVAEDPFGRPEIKTTN